MNSLIVISGPSGVGKGTIVNKLLQKGNYALSISCTTRNPRTAEKDGVSYFFIPKEKFLGMIENGGFLEYSEHFGNYYGTPREFVECKLKESDVILEIEVDGALQVKKTYPSALLIMVLPPSEEELISRVKHRGLEKGGSLQDRLKRMQYELSKKPFYDYTIVNDDLEKAVADIEKIIKSNKNK